MKRVLFLLIATIFLISVAYGIWYSMMSDRVTQVKATIAYHNQQFKSATPNMVLKADDVYAAGFPFNSEVRVKQLSLSMVEGEETYLVRLPLVHIEKVRLGANVIIGTEFEVLYAKSGQAPEHYNLLVSDAPGTLLTNPEKAGDPFTQYRLFLPKTMVMVMKLNGEEKSATFTMPLQNFMIDQPIPQNVQRPLWMLVSIMREALVFHTGS